MLLKKNSSTGGKHDPQHNSRKDKKLMVANEFCKKRPDVEIGFHDRNGFLGIMNNDGNMLTSNKNRSIVVLYEGKEIEFH